MLTEREQYARTKAPGSVELRWVIHNQTTKPWSKNCALKNHCNDDVYVKPITIQKELQANNIREVVMNVYLPNEFRQEKVVLLFQFQDGEGIRFGDVMIGIIDVDLPEDQDN